MTNDIFDHINIMDPQKHTIKCCQMHDKPTGDIITVTPKPCWPVKSVDQTYNAFRYINNS